MNLKKFISGVSALAVAASAFAGLAVTASALDPGTYTPEVAFAAKNRVTNNNDGTFTTANNAGNQYALVLADLTDLEDIGRASSVTIEFDSVIASGSRWNVGIGDGAVRGTNANGSNKTNYIKDGLALYFGTGDGNNYKVNNGSAVDGFGVTVHTAVTLDRTAGKYTYSLTNTSTGSVIASATDASTTVSNFTVVEAYTWLSNNTGTFNNLSVSYVIPEGEIKQYPIVVKSSVGDVEFLNQADVNEGVSVDYSFPKYLTDANNNVIATSSASQFTGTAVSSSTSDSITVPYTAYDGVAIAVEPSSSNKASDAAKFSNANAYRGWNGNITSVTVPADGEYQVSMNVFSNNTRYDAHAIATVGETEIMNENVLVSVNYPTVKTSEKVMLKAGDVITISTDSTNLAVDYIFVEKTGEYVAPAAPELGATIDDQGTENGTEEFANDSATWFIITVANTGDATGSYNTVSITDGTDTFNADVANATLDAGASIVYGGVVQNAYTFTGASVN